MDDIGEPPHPRVGVAEAVRRESGEIAATVGSDPHADRWGSGETEPPREQPADENAADAPVAVGVRMDGLELRVGDGGLRHSIDVSAVYEAGEVGNEVAQLDRWRGDE